MRSLITLLVATSIIAPIKAQVGGLAGAVTDAITGRELVGVVVSVKPSAREDVTDVEGRFLFSNLQPGIYTMELRETNHKTVYLPIVRISPNEMTVIRISMYDSIKSLAGVIITARKPRQDNNIGVASERKSAATITDGISQETIARTPDRNTAESLKRISGVTVQDGKFPIVRGLSDRYNFAMLNGIPMPSTLPDRKAFAFDLIPSGLLDNMLIVKSGTADLPGEFGGAIMLINTRDIPDETVQTLTIGIGGYGNSVGRNAQWQNNKGLDFLGFGTGGRSLPNGTPNSQIYGSWTKNEKALFSQKFENDWGLASKTILPGIQLQYANSSRFKFVGREAGSLLALSYSNIKRYNSVERVQYNQSSKRVQFSDKLYSDNVLLGAMLNFSVKTNKRNKITWRNFFTNNSTEENNIREGQNFETGTDQRSYALNYLQNYFYGSQLAGEHSFGRYGLKLKWDGAIQQVKRNTPDYRNLLYTKTTGDTASRYTAAVGPSPSFGNAGKMYTALTENQQFLSYSLIKSIFKDNFKSDIKIGGFHQFRNRKFDARIMAIVDNSINTPQSLKELPNNQIFNTANMGGNGFRFEEIYDPSYSYTGNQYLHAGYIMTDNIIDRFFRITAGIRVEQFYQAMKTSTLSGVVINPSIFNTNWLPSLALTILANNRTNVRFSYAKTLTRPDFREISPFSYFDFVNFNSIVGNVDLKSGTINSFDCRYETFPGDGQSFSIGAFLKNFKDPVEQIVNPELKNGNRSIQFQNASSAFVYGIEAETRLKLKKLSKKLRYWEISGNFAWMYSEVKLAGNDSAGKFASLSRPLQGQSPYSGNLGLFYNGRKSGWSFSINYNIVGPSIYSVGTVNFPSFYEKPRNIVDVQLAKAIGNRAEIKLNIADVISQDYVLYQNTDSKNNYTKSDRTVNRMKTAPLVLLYFTYRLK